MPSRKEFLKSVTIGAATLSLPVYFKKISRLTPEDYRPNILWITMEDTCHQFIGSYGNKQALTPNMDRLANKGVRFDNAFSSAPVCAPSRNTIITGCLSELMGTGNHRSQYPIPDFIKGFPYYLRKAGYFTSNNRKTDYNLGNSKHFIHEAWDECYGDAGWGTSFGINKDTFDETSKEAGWWHRKTDQPFFSVFNLANSHQSRTMTHPYKWYEDFVLSRIPEEKRIKPEQIEVPPFYRDTPEMRKHLCRVYNSLQYTDMEFGGILNRLKEDGLDQDTIVFCFADHGEGIPKGKTSAVVLGFQVPFFIYFPPKLQHLSPWTVGKATQELVNSSEDTAPTVLSLAGVDIPKHMTGRPILGKQRRSPRPYVFCARNRIDESQDLSRCVTNGRYFYTRVFMPQLPLVKFIKYMEVGDIMRTIRSDYQAGKLNKAQAELVNSRQPVEYLYDLKNDVWQINNLADNPDYQSVLNNLRKALQDHLRKTRDIHFMPEYEMVKRSETKPAYEFRMDDDSYPFERILWAANLVGSNVAVDQHLKALKDPDASVRFWGAVGLDNLGERARHYREEISAGLDDPHPSVQIVMAGAAYKLYDDQRAYDILKKYLYAENENLLLRALQTIQNMRGKSMAFKPHLETQLNRLGRDQNMNYDVTSIIGVTLHFLDGSPLYYKYDEKWTPKSQMKTDPSIHFTS